MEQQALVFQKYAIAKARGGDPVQVLFDLFARNLDAYENVKATPAYKFIKKLASVFDAIADYAQKVKNLLEGNGFQSVRSIYDAAARGLIARQQPDIAKTGGLPGLLQNPDTWANWQEFNAAKGTTAPFGPSNSVSPSLAPRPTLPTPLRLAQRDGAPPAKPAPRRVDNENRARIEANNQAMDALRQKAMKEGC